MYYVYQNGCVFFFVFPICVTLLLGCGATLVTHFHVLFFRQLHKLLTDLPDDMLEDSRDSSSPELEYSSCSNKNTGNRYYMWHDNYEAEYNQHSYKQYVYGDGTAQINGHQIIPQTQPFPHTWNQQSEDHQFTQGDYTYTSMGTEKSAESNDFSADDYESKPYPQAANNPVEYNGEGGYRDKQTHEDHKPRNHFQSAAVDRGVDQYKPSYNPHHAACQPKMFNPQPHQEGQLDHLQREFLDSTAKTADREQVVQLQILHKAQQRQIEDLERKLEDSRRNMRYIEHQFAIVKDEKDGLAVSLKESSRLVEEYKEREVKLQNKVKSMEQQVQILNERDQESMKKQQVAEAAVDSMKQQMLELCRSDTLSRAREQHDRDLTVMREQHEAALLAFEQKLDSTSQALDEQIDVGQRLREQIKQLERQREVEQLERAKVVNGLTQRLEESQQQCAKLLQTSSVQEMSQLQIKLQQAQSAKTLSENMNKVLQDDLAELKEQITLYESAVKHGVISLERNADLEHQLSESCLDLGLKKTNLKNGTLHSTALANLSESKLPRDEALRLLRAEMQRCLGSLKGKRQKISHLQEELQLSQARVEELQTQLDEAKLSLSVRSCLCLNTTLTFQSQLQELEKKNKELKQNEEKVRAANLELCTKMREMIQDLDQEKQEAAERSERIHQQHRDDVVNRVRTELMLEHNAQVEQMTERHQQQLQELQTQLSEVNDKMLAVQECYISVCKEKDMLEESLRSRKEEEASMEKTWLQRLEEARKEGSRETAEVICQTEECEAGSEAITAEELDYRLNAQKQQLQVEADKVKRKAVEEARKQTQRELHEKHLDDMAEQVEGAVTRAYNRWVEDLTSLPEYQASLKSEREMWEESQEQLTQQRISQALAAAEDQWHKRQKNQLEEQSSGAQRVEELQEKVTALQIQLEQTRKEQTALLKAELAGARAVWNRDKQQQISIIKAQCQQAYQTKLEEQHKNLEEQTVSAREAEIKHHYMEKEQALLQQIKAESQAEVRTVLAEVQAQLLRNPKTDQQSTGETRRTSGATTEGTITHMIQSFCKDTVNRAVSQAKMEWKKISEEKLSRVLKETQELHERDINRIQTRCRKECSETVSTLQKKNRELQRHLEKACRQLQTTVREHKTATQRLNDEHESILQKVKKEHLQQLEETKRTRESAGSDQQQHFQQGLEEMKQQYLMTVEKIRGDMLRYLQESRERAAEMIHTTVQRERQDMARKMRRYYLTCLQELLEDGGKTTGAEKKIMSAASKLAAMAEVLETPFKMKSGKNHSLPSEFLLYSLVLPFTIYSRTKASSHQDSSTSGREEASAFCVSSREKTSAAQVDAVSVRSKNRQLYLQGAGADVVDNCLDSQQHSRAFLQEAPIREEKRTDWSLTSGDSDIGFQIPRLSYSGRKVEPVKPFSVSAALSNDIGEFGGLTPDLSDLTVYNEIAKKTPHSQISDFPSVKTSAHRQPTPGSEGEKHHDGEPRRLFSELRQRQQDSGFDSPFYQHK
uniref:Centrosomal protein 152 n=1 Tax=Sphaeramia orbicularis TaxID=375764 RepID=A0A673ADB8_9TELE